MADANKFGELEGTVCPGCGGPIKEDWVACPKCGETLQSGSVAAGNRKTRKKATKRKTRGKTTQKPIADKFVCPGCNKKATAKGGQSIFFGVYGRYIHNKCSDRLPDDFAFDLELPWSYECPGCGEMTTAKNGWLCGQCTAFVHEACLVTAVSNLHPADGRVVTVLSCPACDADIADDLVGGEFRIVLWS